MAEILLMKGPGGLVPADDESREFLGKVKTTEILRCKVSRIRNVRFHRKFFCLVRFLFDIWSETVRPTQYKGMDVTPNIDRFRRDLIVLAGYYDAHYNALGEVRLEAKSISFAKMPEEEFEQLYSRCIDVALRRILNRPDLTEDRVRALVDQLMSYD